MADRISSLPDELICHMLSFLPTKLVVTTSILSKRWKTFWLSVPALDFVDEKTKHSHFVDFVSTVMLLRDVTKPIKKFSLKCHTVYLRDNPSCDVNKWVNAAIQAKVEHLELSLPSAINFLPSVFNLPSSVLCTKTLVVLKLSSLTVNTLSCVDFPSLKILHLNFVRFSKHGYLIELLSGCPILEDLQLISLDGIEDNIATEFKSLPKLVRASLSDCDYTLLKGICNVVFLRTSESKFLPFNDIPTFRNLTQLELILFIHADWLVKVLRQCPNLRILVIHKIDNFAFYNKNWSNPQFVPECLSSHLRACVLREYRGLNVEFARYIMKNARVLRTMTINSTSKSTRWEKLQMIKALCMCRRSSAECELLFK